MLTIKIKGADFALTARREQFAKFLATTIDGKSDDRFEPFMTNKGDTFNWSISHTNDWWAHFRPHDATLVEIQYRYQGGNKAEEALATWLAFRVDATIVTE